jgi:hypothetical protein
LTGPTDIIEHAEAVVLWPGYTAKLTADQGCPGADQVNWVVSLQEPEGTIALAEDGSVTGLAQGLAFVYATGPACQAQEFFTIEVGPPPSTVPATSTATSTSTDPAGTSGGQDQAEVPSYVASPFDIGQALEAAAWLHDHPQPDYQTTMPLFDSDIAVLGTAKAGKVAVISYATGMCPRNILAGRRLLIGPTATLAPELIPTSLDQVEYIIAVDYIGRYGVNLVTPDGSWVNHVLVDTTVSIKAADSGQTVEHIADLPEADPYTEPAVCDEDDVNCIPAGTICGTPVDPTAAIEEAIARLPMA